MGPPARQPSPVSASQVGYPPFHGSEKDRGLLQLVPALVKVVATHDIIYTTIATIATIIASMVLTIFTVRRLVNMHNGNIVVIQWLCGHVMVILCSCNWEIVYWF